MIIFLQFPFLIIVTAILGGLCAGAIERRKRFLSFCLGFASFISFSMLITLQAYYGNKISPIESDISKIEKQLHDYEINNYFSKFCEAVHNTKHADELTIMQTTNKNNEEIWEFCNEKLKNSSVYKEMKNDQNVKNLNKSLSILNAKLESAYKFYYKLLYGGIAIAITPSLILFFLSFCSWISTLHRLDRESREKKIADFLTKINS